MTNGETPAKEEKIANDDKVTPNKVDEPKRKRLRRINTKREDELKDGEDDEQKDEKKLEGGELKGE